MADLNIGNNSANVVINTKHNGSVIPQINNTYDLGTSALRWKNIYGGTFVGSLNGNAATATKATQDGDGNVITSYYLPKTTYEYNKELAFGSSGKLCIGKFPCYDSNISVEIKSTTNTTYNGTLIIATQNINTSLGGVYKAVVYGDENNTLTNSIKIEYLSGSNVFSVYINLPPWSKNILHIQCVSLAGAPTNIATIIDSIPSTATIVPTNAFIHTHNYAGSSSVGGSATSAVKLDSSAGSATQPVYFSNGKPVATTYTLGSSVPSNAKFTDTTYSAGTGLSLSGTTFNHKNSVTAATAQGDASKTLTFGGTFTIPTITYDAQGHITGKGTTTMTMPANPNTDTHWTTGITAGATGTTSNSATTNGNTFIKIKDNSTHRGQIKIVGSGATSVSSNAEGVITISSTDNNTTYGSMSVSEGTTGTATTDRVLTATNLKGIINNYTDNAVSDAKTEITREYSSLINETASQISLTVDELSRTVNANSDSIVHINNSINVTSQDINLVKTTMSNIQNAVNGKVSADEIKEWARFDGATLELGASNQPFKARLTTTELAFYQGSNKVAWISNNEFHILTAIITQSISCGNFTFVDEGSMGFSLL